jgi:hypothetical protein
MTSTVYRIELRNYASRGPGEEPWPTDKVSNVYVQYCNHAPKWQVPHSILQYAKGFFAPDSWTHADIYKEELLAFTSEGPKNGHATSYLVAEDITL